VQRRLAAAPGADYASKLNVARTLEHMAHLHFYTRDLDAAAAWAAEAEAVIDRVEREGGVCNDSQMVRALVYFRRGDIFLHRGNAAAAATEYTRARDILQVLVYASPEDFKIRSQLADTLIQLAVASPGIADTRNCYREALLHYQVCKEAEPSDLRYQYDIA